MEDIYMYSEEDLFKAYDMGLLFAVETFEKTLNFSQQGKLELIEELKKMLSNQEDSDRHLTLFLDIKLH